MIGPKRKHKKSNIVKAKTIIATSLGLDVFLCVTHYEIAIEIGDTLEVFHQGKTEV